ncbi:MAG: HAD family hydrolase [Halobacteriales archaeon]|nr:HAD family hydrolase [Halobacteriales archaeon]
MSPAGYDYWLFDFDGTLVDVEWPYIRRVFDAVGDELDHTFTDAEAARIWHGYDGHRDGQIRATGVERDAFWAAFDAVETPAERARETYLHDDAAVVGELDGPVGIVTHSQPPLLEAVLDRLDIRDWFDVVVSCSDELGWKPDPAPVERARARLPVNGVHEGVLVGDNPHDVGAAWNAGLDAVHVERHGHDRRGLCVLGDHRVESLASLGG